MSIVHLPKLNQGFPIYFLEFLYRYPSVLVVPLNTYSSLSLAWTIRKWLCRALSIKCPSISFLLHLFPGFNATVCESRLSSFFPIVSTIFFKRVAYTDIILPFRIHNVIKLIIEQSGSDLLIHQRTFLIIFTK